MPASLNMLGDRDPDAIMSNQPTDAILYARLLPRVKSVVTDLAVYVGATIVFVAITSSASMSFAARASLFGFLAFLIFYEPFMVWRYGGTIGHIRQNLRIVSERTGGNPGLLASFVRWLVKGLLGALSFFFMALTLRHQALHDTASGTTVRVRDGDRVRLHDFAIARSEPVGAADVPALRRIAVILAYNGLIFVVVCTVWALLGSDACVLEKRCTEGEQVVESIIGLAWVLAGGTMLVLGWKGNLFGARSRSANR